MLRCSPAFWAACSSVRATYSASVRAEGAAACRRVLVNPLTGGAACGLRTPALTEGIMTYSVPEVSARPVGVLAGPAAASPSPAALRDAQGGGVGRFFKALKSIGAAALGVVVVTLFLAFVVGVPLPGQRAPANEPAAPL